ncbi:MAG: hypothetical protein ACYC4H_08545 [Desulfocucumaceae bacterium]
MYFKKKAPPAGGGVTCDSFAGNLVYSHHFENSDDPTVGNPCGGSDNTSALSLVSNNGSYSATDKSDGSYGLLFSGAKYAILPLRSITTTYNIVAKGCVRGWLKPKGQTANYLIAFYVDANNYIRVQSSAKDNVAGAVTITVLDGAGAESKSTGTTIDNTGGWIQAAWDFTPASGSRKILVKVCSDQSCTTGTVYEDTNKTNAPMTDLANVVYMVGNVNSTGNSVETAIDDIRIYDYYPSPNTAACQ